jgi:thiamine kinase-like enzyme
MLKKTVAEAVERVLKTKVASVVKIAKGEFNQVFKVTLETKVPVVARIFRNKNFPNIDDLLWIEKQFALHKLPHAEILHCSRDSSYFQYGLMITKFVHGTSGDDAIKNGAVTFELFHHKLAALLKKVHKIKIDNYGFLNTGKGTASSFLHFWLEKMKEVYDMKYKTIPNFDHQLYLKTVAVVTKLLDPIQNKFAPVLTHCDPGPDNCIWTEDNQIVLIDWDTAMSGIWPYDLAVLTYSGSHLSKFGSLEERQEKIRNIFLRLNTVNNLSVADFKNTERALHLIYAFSLLNYYYFGLKNIERYDLTVKGINSLLKSSNI